MTTHHRRCNNRIKYCLSLHLLPFRNFNCNNQFYQLRIRVFSSKQYVSQLSLSSPLSCIMHLMDSNKINLKKSSKLYSRKSLKKNKKKHPANMGSGMVARAQLPKSMGSGKESEPTHQEHGIGQVAEPMPPLWEHGCLV